MSRCKTTGCRQQAQQRNPRNYVYGLCETCAKAKIEGRKERQEDRKGMLDAKKEQKEQWDAFMAVRSNAVEYVRQQRAKERKIANMARIARYK